MNKLALLAGALTLAGPSLAQHTCTATVAAASCGPTLSVTFSPIGNAGNQTIELTCNGLDPNGIGLMAWGQNLVNVPFLNCPMLTDFCWGHIINLDASGSHTWSRTWPAWVDGYFYMQMASVTIGSGSFTVLTTDAMRAQCL